MHLQIGYTLCWFLPGTNRFWSITWITTNTYMSLKRAKNSGEKSVLRHRTKGLFSKKRKQVKFKNERTGRAIFNLWLQGTRHESVGASSGVLRAKRRELQDANHGSFVAHWPTQSAATAAGHTNPRPQFHRYTCCCQGLQTATFCLKDWLKHKRWIFALSSEGCIAVVSALSQICGHCC